MLKFIKNFFVVFCLLFVFSKAFALPFNIVPNGSLPTTVVQGTTAYASYFVQNMTTEQRNGNFVKYLPLNVAVAPGGCGSTFNLAPYGQSGSSCILNLAVSGAVNANNRNPHDHLMVCMAGGISCAGTYYPLNVSVVSATLTAITVSPPLASTTVGSGVQYMATGYFSDGTSHDITTSVNWQSSNQSVATIGVNTGMATGVAVGTSNITASLNSITSVPVTLTVNALVLNSISVAPATASVAIGGTQQYMATGHYSNGSTANLTNSVVWGTSSAAATITPAGLATGQSATPDVTISATMGIVVGTAELTVTSVTLVSIAITPPTPISLAEGGSVQFTATGTFSDSSTQNLTNSVTWNTSNSSFVTINSTGMATAGMAVGSSNITASSGLITSNIVTVNVTAVTLLSITISAAPSPGIPVGITYTGFVATGHYSDSSTANITTSVTWLSANPAILSIVANGASGGHATGVTQGTTTITATLNAVSSSPESVTVIAPVLQSIAVSPNPTTIAIGGNVQYTAEGTYSGSATPVDITAEVSWTSQFTSIATITAAGMATGVTVGSSTISATLDSITGTAQLNVVAAGTPLLLAGGGSYLIQSTNNGTSWSTPVITGLVGTPTYSASGCTDLGTTSICIAVGANTSLPFLTITTDGGTSWTIPTITGLQTNSSFDAATCSGTGAQAICAAAGSIVTTGDFSPLAVSTSGGSTWSLETITGAAANASLNAVSCTGNATSGLCVVAGDTSTQAPLLAESTNGTSWTIPTISGLPAAGVFAAASCSGSTCVAVGQQATGVLIASTTNGGTSWSTRTASGVSATSDLAGVSCAGTVCVATGIAVVIGSPPVIAPVLVESDDSGATWSVPSIAGMPSSAALSKASCSVNGSTIVCSAVGVVTSGASSTPLLLVGTGATGGALSWSIKTITSAPTTGSLASTTCTLNISSILCIAGGSGGATQIPFLALSTNSGASWAAATLTSPPSSTNLVTTAASSG